MTTTYDMEADLRTTLRAADCWCDYLDENDREDEVKPIEVAMQVLWASLKTPAPVNDDNALYVEVTLPDGTVARWSIVPPDGSALDGYTIDAVTDAIERVLGAPDTLIA